MLAFELPVCRLLFMHNVQDRNQEPPSKSFHQTWKNVLSKTIGHSLKNLGPTPENSSTPLVAQTGDGPVDLLNIKYAGLLFVTWQSQNTNCRKQPRMPVTREKLKDFTSLCVEQCTAFLIKSLSKFDTLKLIVFFGRKHILWDRFQCRFHAVVSYCVLLRSRATQTKPCFCFYQIPCDLSSKLEMHCLSVIGMAVKAKSRHNRKIQAAAK